MPMFVLSVVAAAGSVWTLLFANAHGGIDGRLVVGAYVITGSQLYGIVALLGIASIALLCAAVTRSTQTLAVLVGACAVVAAVGISGLTPEILAELVNSNNWFAQEATGSR